MPDKSEFANCTLLKMMYAELREPVTIIRIEGSRDDPGAWNTVTNKSI